jgi:23S rRNA (cytosine1962-C5)-methyltransferase
MEVRLKPGKDRPLRFGHPWIFPGAIDRLDRDLAPGSLVDIRSFTGDWLARGYVNPARTIAIRVLTRLDETIDSAFFQRRLRNAIALRRAVVPDDTDAYRLVNGEGDGLPGFLADRYRDMIALQVLTAGAERLKPLVVEAFREIARPRAIYERSEGAVREAEGLAPSAQLLDGQLSSEIVVQENSLRFKVDLEKGQKTGLFLDQRINHAIVRSLAQGRRVLDLFTYAGGFALHAAAGGAARVVAVDSSAPALDQARTNRSLNGLDDSRVELVQADAQRYLRAASDRFDLIILDPPALVKQRKDVKSGARAYKDLNLWAFRRCESGAFLLTFTCSQHIDAVLFRKIVLGAAVDAGRDVQLVQHLGPGPDHPVALGHPEGEYLHGLLLRVQ